MHECMMDGRMDGWMYGCMDMCVCTSVCVCPCVSVYVCKAMCVCMHMYEVGLLRIRQQVLVRFNISIYMYVYTYVYIYIVIQHYHLESESKLNILKTEQLLLTNSTYHIFHLLAPRKPFSCSLSVAASECLSKIWKGHTRRLIGMNVPEWQPWKLNLFSRPKKRVVGQLPHRHQTA